VAAKLWSSYDTLLADLDGVVYEGANPIVDAVEVINVAQDAGVKVGYVTNNSSRKASTIAEQLIGFGIPTRNDQVIGSAVTGVELLSSMIAKGARVLVVGGEGLRDRVESAGFVVVSKADDKPAAVIQGFSPDVAWTHLAEASFAIQRGAKWVATNSDWTIPREGGIAPGNGTLVSAVHTAVGQMPVVAGKPEPAIFYTAIRQLEAQNAIFVGDRLDTDICGANRAGIDSVVVLTGVATRKDILGAIPVERPKFIIGTMADLLKPYVAPKEIKRGFACGGVEVELLGNKVMVTHGDPRSLDALKAAAAVIYSAPVAIHALEVEAALYE
jgi:HAD superfamily hydrolase (TIGR01450 family)